MKYYVDERKMEVVSEKDIDIQFMAPETYYEYACSGDNFSFKEVWYVGDGKRINVHYSKDEPQDIIVMKRESIFKENGVRPIFLIRFEVPKEIFDDVIQRIE